MSWLGSVKRENQLTESLAFIASPLLNPCDFVVVKHLNNLKAQYLKQPRSQGLSSYRPLRSLLSLINL